MKARFCLAYGIFALLPFAAHAQPVTGPYVSLGAGTAIENSVNYSFPTNTASGKWAFNADYAGLGSLGYGFGNGLRVELGGDFIRNTADKFTRSDGIQGRIFGAEQKYGPMVNVLYDIQLGLPVTPYVGAGAGYQWVKLDPDIINDAGQRTSGTKGSFAYNVIGGLSFAVPAVPGLSLTAEYRFMQLTQSRDYSYSGPATPLHRLGSESDNIFLLGLRYQLFNPPPVAPVPAPAPVAAAPAPAPARTYLVFFDWDKAALTPRAVQIIAQAAADSHTAQTTTIVASGYTDTSGTATYNLGLSERRAKAVAAQLVADGVPAAEIETHAFGETHLLVPTGPGVREPQNRRVEIDLQ